MPIFAHPVCAWTLVGLIAAGTGGCVSHTMTARLATAPPVDEERLYEDCPARAKVPVPEWVTPYLGRHGLPAPYRDQKRPIGDVTAGLDLWQANHFLLNVVPPGRLARLQLDSVRAQFRFGQLRICE